MGRGRDETTGFATDFRRPGEGGDADATGSAGLVLVYAENYRELPSVFVVNGRTVTVGRHGASDIVLDAQGVSRHHATLHFKEGAWWLTDAGSKNGILVNGAPAAKVCLEEDDVVRIGDVVLKFVATHSESFADFRIDGPSPAKIPELVGGRSMHRVARVIEDIARSDVSCLILGETGTGKEVAAEAIHRLSGRNGAWQAINCAAIPENLLESELFGYRRGAFSGAVRDKPGLFQLADQGTLLLDELGDMPLPAQAKLLRVLQTGEVLRLGATSTERVDVRVVAATHRDLRTAVDEGRFRGDLYARLNQGIVRMPALRSRKEDIYALARAFTDRHSQAPFRVSFRAMVALTNYGWPFHVRELENCIRIALTRARGGIIEVEHLADAVIAAMDTYGRPPDSDAVTVAADSRKRDLAPPEADFRALVERHHGNVSAIARELGKDRAQIHRWLKRFRIDVSKWR